MRKIAEEIAKAIAFAAAAFAVAFLVPVQSSSGYRDQVRRLAARLLGKSAIEPKTVTTHSAYQTHFQLAVGDISPAKLKIVANNSALTRRRADMLVQPQRTPASAGISSSAH